MDMVQLEISREIICRLFWQNSLHNQSIVKGRKQQNRDVKPSDQQGIFSLAGPVHLTFVDWGNSYYRRSVAASLVQGVYTLERDRQNKRTGLKALAPLWWEFFHFQCIQILLDQVDSSIFGAVFEYKPYNPKSTNFHHLVPQHIILPRYVIAFRGTLIEPDTRKQELYLNMHFVLNGLTRKSRYQIALQAVQNITTMTSPQSVWLTGHSLGAAIALLAGKDMAKMGSYIETYLFNPPFPSPPIEKIKDPNLKTKIRFTSSVLTAWLSIAIQGKKNISKQEYDTFSKLCYWFPNLFVNPIDPICCEYIGYFEHRERMEEMGVGRIERIATKNTLVSLLSGALGRDGDAQHLIPSALLTQNVIEGSNDYRKAHGVEQWWKPYPYCQSKVYRFISHGDYLQTSQDDFVHDKMMLF